MNNVTSINNRLKKRTGALSEEYAQESPLIRFISQSVKRPVSIRIDCDTISQLKTINEDPVSELLKEIALWHSALGEREVANVELHYRDYVLPDYDITRLMHGIASEFKLRKTECRVVFNDATAESTALALLKGLGFAICQFAVNDLSGQQLIELQSFAEKARSFRFEKIGVQIVQSVSVETLAANIRQIQYLVKPDYVFVGSGTHKLAHIPTDSGYTLFEDDVCSSNLDLIMVGPSAASVIQGRVLDTLSDVLRYRDAVCQQQLPIIDAVPTVSNSTP